MSRAHFNFESVEMDRRILLELTGLKFVEDEFSSDTDDNLLHGESHDSDSSDQDGY